MKRQLLTAWSHTIFLKTHAKIRYIMVVYRHLAFVYAWCSSDLLSVWVANFIAKMPTCRWPHTLANYVQPERLLLWLDASHSNSELAKESLLSVVVVCSHIISSCFHHVFCFAYKWAHLLPPHTLAAVHSLLLVLNSKLTYEPYYTKTEREALVHFQFTPRQTDRGSRPDQRMS